MTKIMKKTVALILAAVMCLSLAGCGGKTTKESAGHAYVYVPEYIDINLDEDQSINRTMVNNGKVYALISSYDNVAMANSYQIMIMDMDTSETQTIIITTEKDEYVNSFYVDKEDNIWMLTDYTQYDENTYEVLEQKMNINKFNTQGELLSTIDVTKIQDEVESSEYGFYVQDFIVDSKGNITLHISDSTIVVVDSTGAVLYTNTVANWIMCMGITGDDKPIIVYYGNTSIQAQLIDIDKKAMGETYSDFPSCYNTSSIIPTEGNSVLVNTDTSIVSYNLDTGEKETILTWIDSDITFDQLQGFGMSENGDILAVTQTYDDEGNNNQLIKLVKTDASTVTTKTTLTLGCLYLDDTVKKQVVKFNKASNDYRISIIQYYEDGMDYEDAITNMNNAISSGNCPDMIAINGLTGASNYASKGLLVDLNEYINSDADIDLDDYQSNIVTLYSKGDMVYGLISAYSISTLVGKKAILGDRTSWTIGDLIQIKNDNPNITDIIGYATKDSVVQMFLAYNMDEYIDYSTGTCNFNNEEFINLLTLANEFPSEYVYDEDAEGEETKLRNNKQLVISANISSVEQYQLYTGIVEEDPVFIGYPTASGSGNVIQSTASSIAISTSCKYQDAAWSFIRTFLLEDYQNNIEYDFPVLKSAFQKQVEESMKPLTYTDANGEEVTYDNTWGYNDITITIPVATQEVIDNLTALIDSADRIVNYDTELFNIISEESKAYFEGGKTAEAVAEVIQSRVNIYINELR